MNTVDYLQSLIDTADKASDERYWRIDTHAHPEKGCRCLSCYNPPSVIQLDCMKWCEDVEHGEAGCEESGFTYNDALFIEKARKHLEPVATTLLDVIKYLDENSEEPWAAHLAKLIDDNLGTWE